MSIEAKKLDLIERLMQVREEAVLKHYEDLLIQAELQARSEESLNAIEKGEVVSLDAFKNSNKEWIRKNATR